MTQEQLRWPHSPEFGPIPAFVEGTYGGSPWLTHVTSAVDWLGQRFTVGGKVLYCIGAGRGQVMAIGEVRLIRARETYNYTWVEATRTRSDTPTGWEIEVQVLTEKTSGAWSNKKRTKPAWVNAINVTALPVMAP
jgi:hypothetical protein